MSDDATAHRSTRVMMVVATLGALTILGSLAWALTGPAPPRNVGFVGGGDDRHATCFGPIATDGRAAWVACSWAYHDRALVELDPEAARATVLHRWSTDDGNTPDLRILQTCGGGELFVVGETQQTTIVTRRAGEVRAHTAGVVGRDVYGAACDETGVDLFVANGDAYAVHRVTDSAAEPPRTRGSIDIPGSFVAAWSEGGAWHGVVHTHAGAVLAGPLPSGLAPVGATEPSLRACPIGAPGGWLGFGPGMTCFDGLALTREGATFRVSALAQPVDALVVDVGPVQGFGVTIRDEARQLRGRGALDFDLHRDDRVYTARRGSSAPVEIAKAPYSALDSSVHAIPLAGDRVALWGGLGKELVVLGPDLRRIDEPGPLQRALSPFGRFRASANSTFDQVCYFTVLAASLAWLLVLSTYRRGTAHHARFRGAAVLTVVLFAIGAWGFHALLAWL